ncbi:MAG: GNAT family N-acetyltransferase [Cyclobacteriaceae bacterium]
MSDTKISLKDIQIRTTLMPGDLGYVTYLHGTIYAREYNFGLQFETYVSEGLNEFLRQYDPKTNRVWVCEHNDRMIGFMLLINRGEAAQLRYFILEVPYRGIGLGKKLMSLYMNFLHDCGYKRSYLWTTDELSAARSLYERHGFRLTEQRDSEAFGRKVTELRFDLEL